MFYFTLKNFQIKQVHNCHFSCYLFKLSQIIYSSGKNDQLGGGNHPTFRFYLLFTSATSGQLLLIYVSCFYEGFLLIAFFSSFKSQNFCVFTWFFRFLVELLDIDKSSFTESQDTFLKHEIRQLVKIVLIICIVFFFFCIVFSCASSC